MCVTLQQLIAQGDLECERSRTLWKDTCRLIAERIRLHDEFHEMLAAREVSLTRVRARWEYSKTQQKLKG
jgi:hypothetical protein